MTGDEGEVLEPTGHRSGVDSRRLRLKAVLFGIGKVELAEAAFVLQGLLALRFSLIFLLASHAKPCEGEDF